MGARMTGIDRTTEILTRRRSYTEERLGDAHQSLHHLLHEADTVWNRLSIAIVRFRIKTYRQKYDRLQLAIICRDESC